jgi:hypothetical protein
MGDEFGCKILLGFGPFSFTNFYLWPGKGTSSFHQTRFQLFYLQNENN